MSLDPTHTGTEILMRVHEGMKVYDAENHHIGKVRRVQMSGGNDPEDADRQAREAIDNTRAATAEPDTTPVYEDTLVGEVAQSFSPRADLPDELRELLQREGFVQIDSAGFFTADRYATPNQIADVAEDGVMLKVTDDRLITE
jgi:hypothetical protein